MKLLTLIPISFLFVYQIHSQSSSYENALIAASYGYLHSKKSHGANNHAHAQEHAYKAMKSYRKVEKLAEDCGCPKVNEMAYQAKISAKEVLNQDTYERSRFYAKRTRQIGAKILVQITKCSANNSNGYTRIM